MAYTQSDKVNKAEKDYYSHIYGNKPGAFSSENTEKANAALKAYEDRGEFKYDPATDSGYQAARKQYTEGGKQAMKDTLGTATELTGGYDNSYAQIAAQQTYNKYMGELAALMPQYEQQAYGRYQNEGQQMIDYYGILKNAEAQDYAMHRDKVGDFNAEADRLYGVYADEKNFDYGGYIDDRNYKYQVEQDAIANDQWERTFAHQKAQDDAAAVAAQTNAQADYYSALAKYNDSLAESEPVFYEYAGEITDDYGKRTGTRFYYDGREVEYDVGINPYTSTVNPDAKNGTFKNGYQPDNVGGEKLSKTGETDVVNGRTQNIWQTSDGTRYIWDGSQNAYLLYKE
ncbi:MAG: hypothetical protein IJB57_02550 [Clostridia bacterium]|nr:hypothetical protein [Clostridia bacterium]